MTLHRSKQWLSVAALAVLAPAAAAQSSGPTLAALAAFSTGVPSTAVAQHGSVGVGGTLGAELWDANALAGLRLQGTAEWFAQHPSHLVCDASSSCGNTPRVATLLLDAVFRSSTPANAAHAPSWYMLGGVGRATTTGPVAVATPAGFEAYTTRTASGLAWNAGLGLRFPLSTGAWFIEATYLSVPAPTERAGVWPVSIGLEF